MTNPFTPAEWGETYNLAGAEWTPEALPGNDGTVTVAESGQLNVTRTEEVTDMVNPSYDVMLAGSLMLDTVYKDRPRPLLPPPDWINAQSDPRAVAIAALERAGGRRGVIDVVIVLTGLSRIHISNETSLYMRHETNPQTVRYISYCFKVLHTWASAINWEASDAD